MIDTYKFKLAVAQAQSRGWIEGFEYKPTFLPFYVFESKDGNAMKHEYLSLNDILFGTDFCEKFFPEDCRLSQALCPNLDRKDHMYCMVDMDESERIEFLYKHVEGEEEVLFHKRFEFNSDGEKVKEIDLKEKPNPIEKSINNFEILFKGKKKDSGEWVTFGIHDIYTANYAIIESTICVFTGIVGQFKERIFEGDIVRDSEHPLWHYRVIYAPQMYGGWALLCIDTPNGEMPIIPIVEKMRVDKTGEFTYMLKVVKNIYD